MAYSKKHQGDTKVPGSSKLLQTLYQKLHKGSSSIASASKKEGKVEVGKEIEGCIPRDKRGIHIRTSTSNTQLRQKNKSRSRCVKLCNRRSINSKVQGQKIKAIFISKLINLTEKNYDT